jgi:lipopolysaccharide/colanic/teichoic acid biosynthesis glycosyltransferase
VSLKRPRLLGAEPAVRKRSVDGGAASAPSSVAQPRVKPVASVTWILRECSDPAGGSLPPTLPPHALLADTAAIMGRAKIGDIVMISGLEIPALVETCDRLLNRGVAVAVDTQKFPALRGPLSSSEFGVDWVRLAPASGHRLSLLANRIFDMVAGIAATSAFGPLLIVLMLGIRTTSAGPALFRARMVGRDGARFDLYKLRSMRQSNGSDQERRQELYRDFMAVRGAANGRDLKVVEQSRVTPIGRFLRKHSMDELPQFWNVVRGNLSLVGPRPCLPYEYELYEDWHRLRFRGRPGLTGLWQVYGRGRVTFEEMVLMDYCYSWRKSFLLDLRIILRTAVVVITGEGGA